MRIIYPPVVKSLDLGECVSDMKVVLGRIAREDIKLEVVLDPDPLPILADRTHTDDEILRLFSEARDMLPAYEGDITVKTRRVRVDAIDDEKLSLAVPSVPGDYCSLEVTFTGSYRPFAVYWPYAAG